MEREEGRWKKRENGWRKRKSIDARMDAFIKNYSSPILQIFTFRKMYISLSENVKYGIFLFMKIDCTESYGEDFKKLIIS